MEPKAAGHWGLSRAKLETDLLDILHHTPNPCVLGRGHLFQAVHPERAGAAFARNQQVEDQKSFGHEFYSRDPLPSLSPY